MCRRTTQAVGGRNYLLIVRLGKCNPGKVRLEKISEQAKGQAGKAISSSDMDFHPWISSLFTRGFALSLARAAT